MAFVDTSYENLSEASDYDVESDSNVEQESLNPQIKQNYEEGQNVVYYKNPWIQMVAVFALGTPLVWLLLSAFTPAKPPVEETPELPVDEEKVEMETALAEERAKNQELMVKNALQEQKNQEIEVILPEPSPKPEPVAKVTQPPPPKPVTPPSNYRPPPQKPIVRQPPPPKIAEKVPEPEVDPMEQWLASANRGQYFTNISSQNEGNLARADRTAPRLNQERETEIANKTLLVSNSTQSNQTDRARRAETEYPLYNSNLVTTRLNSSTDLLETEELKTRLNLRRGGTVEPTTSYSPPKPLETKPSVVTSVDRQTIDIGSSTEAKLESSVVWTNESRSQNNKKYLLRLSEGLKNVSGEEIVPKGTRAIAVVTEFSGSGLVFMEVTHLIKETGERIIVPPGVMQIEGKNGSPLKADLKRKGDSDILAEVGSVIAPGVERALDSTADSISFSGGNNSFSRVTNRDRDPLASGISGVAEGTGRALNRRLSRNRQESIISYFQLNSGTTVNLVVYEDFDL